MRSRCLVPLCATLLWTATGCSTTKDVGATSSDTAETSESGTTGQTDAETGDGSASTGDGDGDGDGDLCQDCVDTECGTEIAACFVDPVCECWAECTFEDGAPEQTCTMTCGAEPTAWEPTYACIITAITGACATSCADPCLGCLFSECSDPLDVCEQDASCECNLECFIFGGDQNTCEMMCGPANMMLTDVLECFDTAEAPGAPCEFACI